MSRDWVHNSQAVAVNRKSIAWYLYHHINHVHAKIYTLQTSRGFKPRTESNTTWIICKLARVMTWCRSVAYIVWRVQCTRTLTEAVYVCVWVCVVHREQLWLFLPCCQHGVVCCVCLSITLRSVFRLLWVLWVVHLPACQAFCTYTSQKTNKQKINIKNLIQTRNCGHLKPALLLLQARVSRFCFGALQWRSASVKTER